MRRCSLGMLLRAWYEAWWSVGKGSSPAGECRLHLAVSPTWASLSRPQKPWSAGDAQRGRAHHGANLPQFGIAYLLSRGPSCYETAPLLPGGGMPVECTALVVGLKSFPSIPRHVPAAIYIIISIWWLDVGQMSAQERRVEMQCTPSGARYAPGQGPHALRPCPPPRSLIIRVASSRAGSRSWAACTARGGLRNACGSHLMRN